jgi:hypothetical protein
VRQVHGEDVGEALHLVNHRICIRHGRAVLQRWQPRAPHHVVNLFLYTGCRVEGEGSGKYQQAWQGWEPMCACVPEGSSQSLPEPGVGVGALLGGV